MNPYDAIAEQQIPARIARRSARLDAQKEQRELARLYRSADRKQEQELLDGEFGPQLRRFLTWLASIDIEQADELVATVSTQLWLINAPLELRRFALRRISDRIIKIRTAAGLAEIDDPLPGEDDAAFQLVKKALRL